MQPMATLSSQGTGSLYHAMGYKAQQAGNLDGMPPSRQNKTGQTPQTATIWFDKKNPEGLPEPSFSGGTGMLYRGTMSIEGRQRLPSRVLVKAPNNEDPLQRSVLLRGSHILAELSQCGWLAIPQSLGIWNFAPTGFKPQQNHPIWSQPLHVLEFVSGMPLNDLFKQAAQTGSLKKWTKFRVTRLLLTGLEKIHRTGWVHCDIKPANIVYDGDENTPPLVTFIDFDTAQKLSAIDQSFVSGSAPYTPPERFENPLDIGFYTDIFALGLVIYKLILAGRPDLEFGYTGEGTEPREQFLNAARTRLYRMTQMNVANQEDTVVLLAPLVLKMIDPDKTKRPTCKQCLAQLPFFETALAQVKKNRNP